MKLNKEIKEKIDNYFDNITSEDLLNLATNKYNFKINNTVQNLLV